MEKELTADFTVDRENKEIIVEKTFKAPRDKVWEAWTKSDILDQWWAPKPWKARTKSFDLREGGHWVYAMIGPAGEEHWSRVDYTALTELTQIKGKDAFTDSEGNVNYDMPRSDWTVDLMRSSENTIVRVEIRFEKTEDLDKTIEMGFEEGFDAGLSNLEEYLEKK